MKKCLAAILAACFFSLLAAENSERLSGEKFLEAARNPYGRNNWAIMEGEATHRRKGEPVIVAPIYIGIRFTPERTLAQVIINNDEGYYVGQKYEKSKDATSVIPMKKNAQKSELANFGLRPQDLTMTFMFWDMLKELPSDTVRGRDCRVFMLESPDKKEKAKVFISSKYFFPLKIEWLKVGQKEKGKAYRTGEFKSFRKEGNFWLVSSLIIYGPGWKTKVEFEKTRADYSKNSVPKDLFRKLKD